MIFIGLMILLFFLPLDSFVSYMHRFGGSPRFGYVEIILTMFVLSLVAGVKTLERRIERPVTCNTKVAARQNRIMGLRLSADL